MTDFSPPDAVTKILEDRYYQEGEDWRALCKRVARFAASSEPEEVREKWEERFYGLLRNGLMLPNSPALANAGTSHLGCVAACFSFRPTDSMVSIMEVRRLAVMVLKYGGGVGFEFSALRPSGAPIQSTHKRACGPIGVLKDYNAAGDLVTQGGIRKAAMIGVLRIDHPDIVKFICCKEEDEHLANFNISVSIPDNFMRKLAKEPEKPHTCHFQGKQYNLLPDGEWIPRAGRGSRKVLSVQDVWDLICQKASTNGDPGVFFVDHVNRDNPLVDSPSDTENPMFMHGCNPCGELPLPHCGACILASVDLAKFVTDGELDTSTLSVAFHETTRFLDDLIDASEWPDPAIEKVIQQTRQIGVGIMGFTSMLDKMQVTYGSEECVKLIDIIGTLRETACSEESKALAKEKGPYPLAKNGEKHRNSTRLVIAPTGTLAMIADTSWSIEPHTYWAFIERRNEEERIRFLPSVINLLGTDRLESLASAAEGDLPRLNELIQQALPAYMTLSRDILPADHVRVVAAWQRYTDSGISKTIVAPPEALDEMAVSAIYQIAWEQKVKGLTVYPEGSREGEPMSVRKKKKSAIIRLPDELPAKTIKVRFDINGQTKKAFMHVGFLTENMKKPVQMFLTHPYERDETFIQFISLMTRLVSLCLRYRLCPHCGEEALPIGQIIKQLNETDALNMFSVPKILTQILGRYVDDDEPVGTCDKCKGDLVLAGGCWVCVSCGDSICG